MQIKIINISSNNLNEVVMNIFYIYLILLLLMFIFIYNGVDYSIKFAPLKIKTLSLTALTAAGLRYIALLILFLWKNIKFLYLLKPFIFLNILCMPILAMIAIYITARNDNIKFNYCLILSGVFVLMYLGFIVKLPVNIEMFNNMGYVMSFYNIDLVFGTYLIINTILLFGSVILLGYKNTNKLGMYMVLGASAISIAEVLTRASGVIILPTILIGDLTWLLAVNYSLYKFKR
jgi:hypothetical protein